MDKEEMELEIARLQSRIDALEWLIALLMRSRNDSSLQFSDPGVLSITKMFARLLCGKSGATLTDDVAKKVSTISEQSPRLNAVMWMASIVMSARGVQGPVQEQIRGWVSRGSVAGAADQLQRLLQEDHPE